MKKNTRMMKKCAGTLGLALAVSLTGAAGMLASESQKDWGSYQIENDGYGYLTANFPAEFTSEYIIIENDVSTSQKADALLLTLTDEEKKEMLKADGYWEGIPRVGIPEIIFYENEDGSQMPAPGMNAVKSSYDPAAASLYGSAAAGSVKASGANAVDASVWTGADYLDEVTEDAVRTALKENGVIADLPSRFCETDPEEMSAEEIDQAVWDLLFQIGQAGYLGMIQVSRDGLAAIDSDAPDVIHLAIFEDAQTDMTALEQISESGAVLLKNENGVLPLDASFEGLAVTADDAAAQDQADGVSVLYVSSQGEALDDEQQNFLTEQLTKAKDGGMQTVLVLAGTEEVDLSEWADDCDSIVEVWQSTENVSETANSLLKGEIVPTGRLAAAWPGDCGQEWTAGYGLSYTEFTCELMAAETASENDEDYGLNVTVKVTNAGERDGAEVVALYLDEEEGMRLAGIQKTGVIPAGESEELVIHISQAGLVSDENGEKTVREGTRTVYAGQYQGDTSVSLETEVKAAKAGVGVEAEAPEEVAAGEAFDVTISTPTDVISLQILDDQGDQYQPVDVMKQNLGDSITFTYTLQMDESGTVNLNVYTMTAQGISEEPLAQLEVVIK